jgi:GNAT superfamily N-acetyltransferase
MIRTLDPTTDRALVDALFQDTSDYVLIERGEPPGPEVTEEFFTDAPPGCDPGQSLRLGLFDGDGLAAIAECGFGFPEADDAYLGLMIVAPGHRGRGIGARFLRHVEAEARARGCKMLYLAVLEANPRGRAFWEREGFRTILTDRPVTLGAKTQMARRMAKRL